MSERDGARREGSAGRRSHEAGFTLVELLTVVSIISILMALMLYGLNAYRQKAYDQKSVAIIEKVRSALSAYHAEFRKYPPDGYDAPTFRGDAGSRVQIQGAQCLVYFLGFRTVRSYEVGEERRTKVLEPFLELTGDMLSGGGDLETMLRDPRTTIVDGFSRPIRYDNVEKDSSGVARVSKQTSEAMPGDEGTEQAPDPRGASGGAVKAQNPGSYDLWSHGRIVTDPSDDHTNWN